MSPETNNIYGDAVQGDKFDGDKIGRDKIVIDTIYQGLTVEEVAKLVAELKNQDQPEVWNGRFPYLGLTAFQESDAQFFFGRESLVEELLVRVQEARFIVIAGPSGSGKSSVARAGLFHALREGKLDKSNDWLLATMQPKGDPIEQLAAAIDRMAKRPGAGDYVRENGRFNPLALHEQIEPLLSDDPRQRYILLVDQFEETFTQTKEEDRAAFIGLLTEAAGVKNGRLTIILSLRADFVSHCARYADLRKLMSKQFQLVGAMDPSDLAKAITLPALEVGAKIDPALVSRIMADMKGEPGALPLMSFALRDLFEAEKSTKGEAMDLTLPEYLQRGGIESALERHANGVFAAFTDEQKLLARGVFSKLIEVGQGRADTRRTAVFTELIPAGVEDGAVTAVVDALAQEGVRLITTSGSGGTVTITHEKLIDAWPWLRQLVDENREMIVLQNQINDDAKSWTEKEDSGYLYRGGRLIQVEEQLKTSNPDLNKLSQEFIQASLGQRQKEIEEKEAQRRKTITILATAFGVTLIFAAVAFLFFLRSNDSTNVANKNLMTATAALITAEAANADAVFQRNEAAASEVNALAEKATALAAGTAEANAVATAKAESTRAFYSEGIAQAEAATAKYNAEELATAVVEADAQRNLALDNLSFSIVAQKDSHAIQATALALAVNYKDLLATITAQNINVNSTPEILAMATAQAETLLQVRMTATANASFSTTSLAPTNVGSNAMILDIPYRSQWDNDAGYYLWDGGATILAMLFNVGGVNIGTDSLTGTLFPYKERNDFFTFSELIRASVTFGDDYGVPFEYVNSDDAESATIQLHNSIDEGKPFMALVKYEPWKEITGNLYADGAFALVVGYDDESVYIHDPLFGSEYFQSLRNDGAYFKLPTELFLEGWGGFDPVENPNFAAIIPVESIASQLVIDVLDETPTP